MTRCLGLAAAIAVAACGGPRDERAPAPPTVEAEKPIEAPSPPSVTADVEAPPRLEEDDPPTGVYELRVTVEDADGRRLPAEVRYRSASQAEFGWWPTREPLRSPGPRFIGSKYETLPFDVLVTCPGFLSSELHDVRDDVRVVLRKSKPRSVRVVLAPDSPFRGPLYASVRWIDPKGNEFRMRPDPRRFSAPLDGDRSATLTVDDPGRYAIELEVQTRSANIASPGVLGSGASVRRRSRLTTLPADPVVTVGDDGAPAEVVVAIAPDDE